MKKYLIAVTLTFFTSISSAGFLGGVLEGMAANALSGKGGAYISENKKRMDQVNLYLWNQHENKSYNEHTNFYVQWLETQLEASGYDDITKWDTLAWVYKDNGDKKKAIEIYKHRIIPWIRIRFKNNKSDKKFRAKWEGYYKKIQQ